MSEQYIGMPEIINMMKDGKYQQSIPLLKDQLGRNPNNLQAIACLAASYSQTGMKTEAIAEFARLTELQPKNAVHYYNLGGAYESVDDAVKAKESLEKALALEPANEKIRQRLDAVNAKTVEAPAAEPAPAENSAPAFITQTALDGTVIQVPVPPAVKS
ncbi:MAG: tetratricopeptide repeat protein [Armatimonadota bacterium]